MADKDFSIMEQYECRVRQAVRGRGAFILDTDKGPLLLREYNGRGRRLEAQAGLLEYLNDNGIMVDYYIKNREGSYLSTDQDGVNYTVTRWFRGRECDTRNFQDICLSLAQLAKLHKTLEGYTCGDKDFQIARNLAREYDKHNKELKMIKNYLMGKHNKNDFELLAYSSCGRFHEEGIKSCEILDESEYEKEYNSVVSEKKLCHGDFNYHNIYVLNDCCELCGFEKSCFNLRIWDLYNFMRKLMEKYEWDIKLGFLMFREYDNVYTLSHRDIKILGAMFSYPEKYWKILNYYYNSNKAWIPSKSIEKLKSAVKQNDMRKAFVNTLL